MPRDALTIDTILREGLAGGISGCVAKSVVAPFDRVKIIFQTSNPDFQKYAGSWSGAYRAGAQIFRDSGTRGLFQGHSATLLRVFPYAAIRFMAYSQATHVLMPTRDQETHLRRFTAGAASGMISVVFTYPLEVVRVRMAFQTSAPPSFFSALKELYAETSASPTGKPVLDNVPLLKFYRGFTATMVGMVPYAGISFLVWGGLRAHFVPDREKATPIADASFGAVAGAMAQTVSYPLETIRRRMQVGGITHPDRWLGWRETVTSIYRTHGLPGFYVGLTIGYLKIVPLAALSFSSWQSVRRILGLQ